METDEVAESEADEIQGTQHFAFPKKGKKPCSEFRPYWYTLSWPHLFPNGNGDINQIRDGKTPSFYEWINHCKRYHDGRFRNDPTFLMVTANQFMRRKCLSIGNLVAKEQDVQQLSVKDVKEAFKEGNENSDMRKKIVSGLRY